MGTNLPTVDPWNVKCPSEGTAGRLAARLREKGYEAEAKGKRVLTNAGIGTVAYVLNNPVTR